MSAPSLFTASEELGVEVPIPILLLACSRTKLSELPLVKNVKLLFVVVLIEF